MIIYLCLLGCKKTDEKLFWITENTEHRSDFLFMAESTNVPVIKGDSLKLLLKQEEIEAIATDSITFKHFGKIYRGNEFSAHVLLLSMKTIGRFYCFIIRTYDKDFRIIDDFELAA